MDKFKKGIGNNIREIRKEQKLSQEKLADMCGFSNTTLSAYENSRKIPNLETIACIAKQLNVSIERLYYGDENNSFIKSESDDGKKIVNSLYLLWNLGVIDYYPSNMTGLYLGEVDQSKGYFLYIRNYIEPVKRFINSLNEFKQKKETYSDPEKYLDMLKNSVAIEINNQINNNKKVEQNGKEK